MLRHPTTPLVVGAIAILGIATYLTITDASPGPLSTAHAKIPGLETLGGCERCHAKAGLSAGCLDCHVEIASQLDTKTGYHPFLVRDGARPCSECHAEHLGDALALTGALAWNRKDPKAFRHPHVRFGLEGRHASLDCEACHARKDATSFLLAGFPALPRDASFLGLDQACAHCHADPHGGRLSLACEECHSQDAFKPARNFDHDRRYPLRGAHRTTRCDGCHVLAAGSDRGLPQFKQVRGTRCVECHASPHRADWKQDCESCHPNDGSPWSAAIASVTPAVHERSGFRLLGAHATVDCAKCHASGQPFAGRYVSAGAPRHEARCESCHEDVHRGQFASTHSACTDCHDVSAFTPARLGVDAHATFPLTGPHATTACNACHLPSPSTGARTFVGTPRECSGCHRDPHAGQFAASKKNCVDCHEPSRFVPSRLGVADHLAYPLEGKHVATPCASCHPPDAGGGARRFVGTSRDCAGCHSDPHQGQFAATHSGCQDCHGTDAFKPVRHGVEEHRTFPLTGSHVAVACTSCHTLDRVTAARTFVATPRECKACHSDPHGGQFAQELRTGDCTSCHRALADGFGLRPFDHARLTGYALDGRHAGVACEACHREREIATAPERVERVRMFRPTSRTCASCHADPHLGQFGRGDEARCERCHPSTTSFGETTFDHSRDSRFVLDGVHRKVECRLCHLKVMVAEDRFVTQFKPLGTACKDCHGFQSK